MTSIISSSLQAAIVALQTARAEPVAQVTPTVPSDTSEATDSDGAAGAPDGPKGPPPPNGGMPPPPPSDGADAASLFQALLANDDSDEDGLISLAEAEASPVADLLAQDFETIDTDGDGFISEDEMAAFEGNRPSGPDGGLMPPPNDQSEEAETFVSLFETLVNTFAEASEDGSVTLEADLVSEFQQMLASIR